LVTLIVRTRRKNPGLLEFVGSVGHSQTRAIGSNAEVVLIAEDEEGLCESV
jgi:hypothetical protein